jgi:primosomal protein N'
MQVVEVIPIAKGITKPTLSYFTSQTFEPGSFVKIPVRSGSALGIVTRSYNARGAKDELKKSSFSLKKLSKLEKTGNVSASFMRAIQSTADFYATTAGNILGALIPKIFLTSPKLLGASSKEKNKPFREVRLIQLPNEERFREYRGIIRECFAKETSVMLCAPTHSEAVDAFEILRSGIEEYAHLLSNKKPKELEVALKSAREEKHPVLCVITPAVISFHRTDLETIILERENSRSYRTLSRPYIHLRTFLKYFARESGKTLILGDAVLSLETLWREHEEEYTEVTPLTWRAKSTAHTEIIDTKTDKFEILSQEVRNLISRALSTHKKIFLFGARKGLAPLTMCGDCGALLLCTNCQAPLVLHQKTNTEKDRMYICRHCGAKRSAETRCDTCNSWKLSPLGIGTDTIAEEVKKLFPTANVFVLDKDHSSTSSLAQKTFKQSASTENSILIGTEMALTYLKEIPYAAVISLDALFSIPDFGINERIFYLINRLREITTEEFVVQTRNAKQEVLRQASEGNILDFYRAEIQERQELRYPPFSLFIKVSTEGTQSQLEKKASYLQHLFKNHEPHFTIENRAQKAGSKKLSMILRLTRETWPVQEVSQALLLLPPDFLIKVDPDSIL